jgi:hypothetical protein
VVPIQLLALFSSLIVSGTLGNRKEKQVSTLVALIYRVNGMACKPSTRCGTYQTQIAGGEVVARRGSECNKRTHTQISLQSRVATSQHSPYRHVLFNKWPQFQKSVYMSLSGTRKVPLSFTYRRDACILNKSELIQTQAQPWFWCAYLLVLYKLNRYCPWVQTWPLSTECALDLVEFTNWDKNV